MILQGAKNCEGSDGFLSNSISRDRFIIDNCKTIFFVGHETTAITASWCLMVLAAYQDRARAELTVVIQETLRLYSPAIFVTRTDLQDVNVKGIKVPKGMNMQIPISILLHDIDIWGPDAHEFNPKIPQAYMPFGIGPCICPGQHLAMLELKVILSLILSKFRLFLSSSYAGVLFCYRTWSGSCSQRDKNLTKQQCN
ncbi:hypothetical protein RYX36_029209 [Vicia faba]